MPGTAQIRLSHADSTVKSKGISINPKAALVNGWADTYFGSLVANDNALDSNRLRYILHSTKGGLSRSPVTGRLMTRYFSDSGGTTYYFPSLANGTGSHSNYFRGRNDFVPWPSVPIRMARQPEGLISLHGNFLYEFLYRSRTDTPFFSQNFRQHTAQVYADLVFKKKYPFRVILTGRTSNSPFFRDFGDISVTFNGFTLNNGIKDRLVEKYGREVSGELGIDFWQSQLENKVREYGQLLEWFNHPARLQEVVVERESHISADNKRKRYEASLRDSLRVLASVGGFQTASQDYGGAYFERVDRLKRHQTTLSEQISSNQKITDSVKNLQARPPVKDRFKIILDSLVARAESLRQQYADGADSVRAMSNHSEKINAGLVDSLRSRLASSVAGDTLMVKVTDAEKIVGRRQKELDSSRQQLAVLRQKVDSVKNLAAGRVAAFKSRLATATTAKEIGLAAEEAGTSVGPGKLGGRLMSVRQFGVGRVPVSYSDLTVRNISITGVNIEYNDHRLYAAVAAGGVDYRFRDFIAGDVRQRPRQRLLLGRLGVGNKARSFFILTAYTGTKSNYSNAVQDPDRLTSNKLFGYSAELKYMPARNVEFSGEVAKSSVPYRREPDRGAAFGKSFSFSDNSNEAWSAKLTVRLPLAQATFNGFYRRTGASFQSYSIFNTGIRREAWGLKWQQYFFKRQLGVTAQLRRNDFDNPLAAGGFKSSSVLKSMQAVFRRRRWPLATISFMPVSQLSKSPGGNMTENLYYASNASLAYAFRLRRRSMNTTLLYSGFRGGMDTGLTSYKTSSLQLQHYVQFDRVGAETHVSGNWQYPVSYFLGGQKIVVQSSRNLSFGAGVKAAASHAKVDWGGSAQATLAVRNAGTFQLLYDRGFIPDYYRQRLSPNDWGRIMWTRNF